MKLLHLAARAVTLPVLCAVAVALSGQDASSQTARTIKIVAPVAPGGVGDTIARLLGEQVGRAQGQTVLIENRTGAGGVIAAEAVSRAAPDGHTLLINTPNLVIASHLRKLSYHPVTSFEPICKLVNSPSVLAIARSPNS